MMPVRSPILRMLYPLRRFRSLSLKARSASLALISRATVARSPAAVSLQNSHGVQMNLETGPVTNSWRDPDANFCCICGDEEEEHVELTCPYNYLSPASYSPCRARLIFWGNERTAMHRRFRTPKEAPRHDEVTTRRLKFLQCFVRVNNLPEQCHAEQLVGLFSRFGALRCWHVALHSSGACKVFGYVIFQHREHAEEAIDALNCYNFGGCKLRVDWAYPCA